jgi:hypothetical protein
MLAQNVVPFKRLALLEVKTTPATDLSSHRLYQGSWSCGTRTTSARPATVQ